MNNAARVTLLAVLLGVGGSGTAAGTGHTSLSLIATVCTAVVTCVHTFAQHAAKRHTERAAVDLVNARTGQTMAQARLLKEQNTAASLAYTAAHRPPIGHTG